MSGRHAVFLTARREVRELLRSRAFRISTGIQLAIVIAIVVISGLSSGDSTDKFDVAYVGAEAQRVVDAARKRQASVDAKVTPHTYDDAAAARAAVADDDVDAAVVPAGLIARSNPSDTLLALLQGASASVRATEVLERQGVGSSQIEAALAPPPLPVTEVGGRRRGAGSRSSAACCCTSRSSRSGSWSRPRSWSRSRRGWSRSCSRRSGRSSC